MTTTAVDGSTPGVTPCTCPEARAWRDYWTREAIAERLTHEIELYQGIAAGRDRDAANDMRGPRRVGVYADGTTYVPFGTGPPYAELERRRAEPGTTYADALERRRAGG